MAADRHRPTTPARRGEPAPETSRAAVAPAGSSPAVTAGKGRARFAPTSGPGGGQGHRAALDAALGPARARGPRRRWILVLDDQLTDAVGPLAEAAPTDVGIVLVESAWKARRRPYHQQKLALVWANQRHFAVEQAQRGVAVRYLTTAAPYPEVLAGQAAELGPLTCMEPAEAELRRALVGPAAAGHVRQVAHAGWLSTHADFDRLGEPPWRMDAFYRHMRRQTGILMEGPQQPRGGRWSLDADNRQPYRGTPPAPALPRFVPDALTREVGAMVSADYADHPGAVDLAALPASRAQVDRLWQWAKSACLPHFGPFEDAMASASSNLFHSRISALLNLHRLLPAQVLADALALDLPLASLEGFVRQILGWREFVRHVHRRTDGLTAVPTANALGATGDLPEAYYYAPSGLNCLDTVVADVWREAHSHHITRLMVLSNLATLMAVDPRQLTDWFWIAYDDAWDWVVEPNVLGMGTFALGDLMITKPYVSGAAYIHRMSDYCRDCAFHPTRTCPITPMYWAFLARHKEQLAHNHRLKIPLAGLARRTPAQQAQDVRVLAWVQRTLAAARRLVPDARPA